MCQESLRVMENESFVSEFGDILNSHCDRQISENVDRPAEAFSRYLRALRSNRKLSRSSLSRQVEIKKTIIIALEHGLIPSNKIEISLLSRLANALNADIEDFAIILERDLSVRKMRNLDRLARIPHRTRDRIDMSVVDQTPIHDHPEITIKTVRDALNAWQNASELGRSPLVRLQIVSDQREAMDLPDTLDARGRALWAVLRESIYTFPRPASEDQVPTKAEWPFYLLSQCFIEGSNRDYVANQMGIGRRTFFEEQARAIETLLELLQQREADATSGTLP